MSELSSKELADLLEKRHDNVLRDIRKHIDTLGTKSAEYFKESSYADGKGTKRACYSISEQGAQYLAERLTEEKAKILMDAITGTSTAGLQEDTKKEYTVEEASKLLQVSERSIYNWIKAGKLKAENRSFEVLTTVNKMMVPEEEISRHKQEV